MKRVINGKLYNTETADMIDDWGNGLAFNDFHRRYEVLYKTQKGQFFLYGEGGAATSWASPVQGGGRCEGESIKLMTEEDARQWCEMHGTSVNTMAEYFTIVDG